MVAAVLVAASACGTATSGTTKQAPEQGGKKRGKTAVMVSMGDSYISGEAGRWAGNAATTKRDAYFTDLAASCDPKQCTYNPRKIYGASYDNGCNRSKDAEIKSAKDAGLPWEPENIACSGAEARHILDEKFKGEDPQSVQLFRMARAKDVRLVVVSIGGNDMHFSGIIWDCYVAWNAGISPKQRCKTSQEGAAKKRLEKLTEKVSSVLHKIATTLRDADGQNTTYRLVVQSYPSILPDAANNRYKPDSNKGRKNYGGCPFWDDDAEWARKLVGRIAEAQWAGVQAYNKFPTATVKADFLDLQQAFNRHEVCSGSVRQAQKYDQQRVKADRSEWVRYLAIFATGKSQRQESVHPNYYGQKALGHCLKKLADDAGWKRKEHRKFACSLPVGKNEPQEVEVARASQTQPPSGRS